MAKNIVLCADGTGNSSGALFTTNVWRLYQALDLDDAGRQVAFYHDGVGTNSIRPLALLTGAVGYGLKRNVLEIYRFLCRNYQPDDRIFGFGFSRGSFTIRLLMGFVATQGLVRYSGDEAKLASDATAAYRRFRQRFHTFWYIEQPFRAMRDGLLRLLKRNTFDPTTQVHPNSIHFVGVWDTVDAYGGPIDEISDGIDYWMFPLSLRDLWLPAKIRRACHALALDEERQAFWPRIWHQGFVEDGSGNYPQMEEGWQPVTEDELREIGELPENYPLQAIDQKRLTQVWFPGVHSDVGGGYSKAGLSYVSLKWMMDRALAYGLRVKPIEKIRLFANANKLDEMNDSRRGVGTYYRYQPRKLKLLYLPGRTAICARAWYDLLHLLFGYERPWEPTPERVNPVIHESVFKRIAAGANPYAPVVLQEGYEIAFENGEVRPGPYPFPPGPHANTTTTNDGGPVPAEERIWNLVWFRRVIYYVTLLTTASLIVLPLLVHRWYPGNAVALWASFLIPLAIIVILLLPESSRLKAGTANAMWQIWGKRLGRIDPNEAPRRARWPADSAWVYRLRMHPWYLNFFSALRWCVLPTFTFWIPVFLILDWSISRILPTAHWWIIGAMWLFMLLLLAANIVIAVRGEADKTDDTDGVAAGTGG